MPNKRKAIPKIRNIILFFLIALLVFLVLYTAAEANNTIEQERAEGTYTIIQEVAFKEAEKENAPGGVALEYCFPLEKINRADILAFFISHHDVEVYLEESCVYRVTGNSRKLRTTGGTYVMIPLYEEDAGKEVRVVLSSRYKNYSEVPEFYVGSELSIYKAEFEKSVPELILSLSTALVGVFLLCLAAYHSVRYNLVAKLYPIGLLAVSAGIWRFTYGRFAYLMFDGYSVLIYTISILALMLMPLAMLGCVTMPEHKKTVKKVIKYATVTYVGADVIQLLLQALGVLDLRQMLWMVHLMVVFSAVMVLLGGLYSWSAGKKHSADMLGQNYSWLLGIGAIIDLLLYYYAKSSPGILFTLAAILCFSMLEAIRLLVSFSRQKDELEEMEVKLTLSRTATMMSQIRSHFVFNLLNAISGMCKYDPAKADDTVVRFARYLRNNIDIMEKDNNIPFATDLKQLEDYVALEQVRFGDKVEFYTDIETVDFMIPPLILQPVVENAIKHGISKKKGNGTIILRTFERGEQVVITVEDDGVGFDVEKVRTENPEGKSVGLKNIRFRLEHLVNGTLDITSRMGVGTTVTITIPKNSKEEGGKQET